MSASGRLRRSYAAAKTYPNITMTKNKMISRDSNVDNDDESDDNDYDNQVRFRCI